jgi:hypothetical protein
MDQTRKRQIMTYVKPVLQKYGMKGTLRTRKYGVTLTLRAGPVDFIADMLTVQWPHERLALRETYCLDVNPYWYQTHYCGDSLTFLTDVLTALNVGNHDLSDIRMDYFDVGWYVDVHVGTSDCPYIVTKG